ncbi:MAG TPA: DNA-binding response regulator [Elusimicrobia bacterium]|nr:DNA-binding response regulator [Elusimicrobiota bacterium]
MRYKVLVIDDHKGTLEALKMLFSYENYSVITAENGKTGINLAIQKQPDLIILDLVLPDIHGYKVKEILKKDKNTSQIPLMILTGAHITAEDEVKCLKTGAGEFIRKPINNDVFLARLKNLLKNNENNNNLKETKKIYGFEINEEERYIKTKDGIIELTQREYDLFILLIKNKEQVLTKENLLEKVWGYGTEIDTHTLESHIFNLRKKLGPENEKRIKTITGIGYKFKK